MNVRDTLLEFTRTGQRTSGKWFQFGELKVYLRVSQRFHIEGAVLALDVASVEVEPKHQGKGIFSGFLKTVEQVAVERNLYVFVESIMNPLLVEYLPTRGYSLTFPSGADICPNALISPTEIKIRTSR